MLDLGTACKFPSGVVYAAPSGKCAVTPGSNAATDDRSKVNLMELNLNAADGDDNYDLSAKVLPSAYLCACCVGFCMAFKLLRLLRAFLLTTYIVPFDIRLA